MLAYIKDFMLNIFIVFFPLLLYPYLLKIKEKSLASGLLLYTLYSLPLTATMLMPVQLSGFQLDFRSVPLTIGILYVGWPLSILLYATLLVVRYATGAEHILVYLVSSLPVILMAIRYARGFAYRSARRKIADAMLLCLGIKLAIFVVFYALTGQFPVLARNFSEVAIVFVAQGLVAGLGAYLIELLRNYHQMQEDLVRSEKMKIVGDMAASVAHEIRNPLTTVRGFIQLLATVSLTENKKEAYKAICFEELDRAERIISDYLALAKPDPEVVETINLNEEVEYLSNVLLTYANYNNIEIRLEIDKASILLAMGDRYKFRQALINIGKNAIEAMNEGGVLRLHANRTSEGAAIVVGDSGVGMTSEQIKRLGTPYYSTKDKGTGLGTMVSFSIIKKMNGKIRVRSDPGKGTEFSIVFPERPWREGLKSG